MITLTKHQEDLIVNALVRLQAQKVSDLRRINYARRCHYEIMKAQKRKPTKPKPVPCRVTEQGEVLPL